MITTKKELVDIVANETGLTKSDAERAIAATFDAIKKDGARVSGFGNFKYKERAARTGRNPQTGAELVIAARTTLTFKPY